MMEFRNRSQEQMIEYAVRMRKERDELLAVLKDIYPHLAGRVILLQEAGEEKSAAIAAEIAQKVYDVTAGRGNSVVRAGQAEPDAGSTPAPGSEEAS